MTPSIAVPPPRAPLPANLNINYRLPTRADQWVVIRTQLLEQKGRKVVVGAEMSNLEGEVLADAKCVLPAPYLVAQSLSPATRDQSLTPPSSFARSLARAARKTGPCTSSPSGPRSSTARACANSSARAAPSTTRRPRSTTRRPAGRRLSRRSLREESSCSTRWTGHLRRGEITPAGGALPAAGGTDGLVVVAATPGGRACAREVP